MKDLYDDSNRVAGTVKFGRSVPITTLSSLIAELKTVRPNRWVDLHIRKGGDDGTHYIAFHYILEDGSKRHHDAAVHSLLQFLRDRLGEHPHPKKPDLMIPNGVCEWSISTVEVLV